MLAMILERRRRKIRLVWPLLSLVLVADAWQLPPADSTRREAVQRILTTAVSGSIALAAPQLAAAAADEDEFVAFTVEPFAFEIPKSWKVIIRPNPNKPTVPRDGKVFSALDLGTGAVLTVVQEQICSRTDYALNEKQCDLVAGDTPSFGESTFPKDVTKLLRRHDDRDNAALQGNTVLDRIERDDADDTATTKFRAFATTSIPTGGTYKDRMGLDQPYMIARTVQSQVRVVDNDRVFSLWLSAPSDEWRKPLVGTRLLQVWASIQ